MPDGNNFQFKSTILKKVMSNSKVDEFLSRAEKSLDRAGASIEESAKKLEKHFENTFTEMDKMFKDTDKMFDDLFKDPELTTTTMSQSVELHGSTKETALKEANSYTAKGYKLVDINVKNVGTPTELWTVVLKREVKA